MEIHTRNYKSYFTVPSSSRFATTAAPLMTLPGTSLHAQRTLCIPGPKAAHNLSPQRRARAPRYGFPITTLTDAFQERRTPFGTNRREPLCSAPAAPRPAGEALPRNVSRPQALPWSMPCNEDQGGSGPEKRGSPQPPAPRRYLGRVVRADLGDDPIAGLVVRPQPGLAGDHAAHTEQRLAAEQREQPMLAPHVLPGQHRQPLLRQRPPHGLVVQGKALRIPRPLLQRPILAHLFGHSGDRAVQLLAGHGSSPDPDPLPPPATSGVPRKPPQASPPEAVPPPTPVLYHHPQLPALPGSCTRSRPRPRKQAPPRPQAGDIAPGGAAVHRRKSPTVIFYSALWSAIQTPGFVSKQTGAMCVGKGAEEGTE